MPVPYKHTSQGCQKITMEAVDHGFSERGVPQAVELEAGLPGGSRPLLTSEVCLRRRRVQGWLAAICFVLGHFLTHTTLRERLSLHRLAPALRKDLVPNVWGAVTPHMRKQAQGEKVSPKPDGISGR